MKIEKIAELECVTLQNPKAEVAIVMLHGYGANMHDLAPLSEVWEAENFAWYFPNAPLHLPMGFFDGRAWFSIDIEELERAMREGTSRDLSSKIPPEFDSTMRMLKTFLKDLQKRYRTVLVGGFSQGAMCASHLALDESLGVKGLILLSGSLLASSLFPDGAKKIPFVQSHGEFDQILSLNGAKNLHQKLVSLGLKGELITFSGGHEIPPQIINKVRDFLDQFAH